MTHLSVRFIMHWSALGLRLALCREPGKEDVARGVKFAIGLVKDLNVAPDVALNQFCKASRLLGLAGMSSFI